ncbi:MAG: hypothetical protein AB7H77_11135 [Bdellovibrionales bacterium]
MKTKPVTLAGLAILLCLLLGAGGILWLARADLMPPVHTVNEALPDDHIPR